MSGFGARFSQSWQFHRQTSRSTDDPTVGSGQTAPSAPREMLDAPSLRLPEPAPVSGDLGELLARRFSCRRFTDEPLSLAHLSNLLFAAYGVQGRSTYQSLEFLERPVPSAGGLFPLELYVLASRVESVPPGVQHYAVIGHRLEEVRGEPTTADEVDRLFLDQPWLTAAPAIVVVTAVVDRLLGKYGDRGYRYLLLEAGHVLQNLNLAASALGLGSCNIGGFLDRELGDLLRLDEEEEIPLYAAAVGHAAGGPREVLRTVEGGPVGDHGDRP